MSDLTPTAAVRAATTPLGRYMATLRLMQLEEAQGSQDPAREDHCNASQPYQGGWSPEP